MKPANPIIIVFFLFSFSIYGQTNTASFHHCHDGCGVYPGRDVYRGMGDVLWSYSTSGKIFSSPAVAGNIAYVGSEDGHLYAVDAKTGKLLWKFKTGGGVHSSPALLGQTVFFLSFDGNFYAVDAKTGKEKWRVRTGGEKWMGGKGYFGMKPDDEEMDDPWDFFLSSPAFDTDDKSMIYFGSSDGALYAVEVANGSIKWKFQTEGNIHTTPVVDASTVYVGNWEGSMYAVDRKTGNLKWKFDCGKNPGFTGIQASPVINNGRIFFGARDAKFYCLDAATGSPVWTYDAENSWILSTATIKDDVVYFGTSDSYLLVGLDVSSGRELMRFKTHGYVYGSPSISGRTAYFGDFTGKLFALDLSSSGKVSDEFVTEGRKANSAKVLHNDNLDFMAAASGKDLSLYTNNVEVMEKFYSLGSIVSSAAIVNDVLYVGSADRKLYAIKLQ